MPTSINDNDEVILAPGAVVQDSVGSDHYKPVPVSGGAPVQISFSAAFANSGDVDVLENWTAVTVHLHGMLRAAFRGNDLVIRMLETDEATGQNIDHYLYIKDYLPSLHRINLVAWDGPASKTFTPTAGLSLGEVGDNTGNILLATYQIPDFGGAEFSRVHGLNGDDLIVATEGAHDLYGGNGDDLYIIDQHKIFPTSYAATIVDTGGENDRLRISGFSVDPQSPEVDSQILLQLKNIYAQSSGLEYLEADDDSGVRWGWDRYEPGLIGMISGITRTTTTGMLYGTDGIDMLFGGIAADGATRSIDAGAGNDWIVGSNAAEELSGGSGDDYIIGYGGYDVIHGNNGNDRISGSGILIGDAGDDVLNGGSGDDILIGGDGNDQLNGGAGIDTVDYSGSNQSVRVDISAGRGVGGDALGDTYMSIENVTGSIFDDLLIGDSQDNTLSGGAGNDVLIGGMHADVLDGGGGFDIVSYSNAAQAVHIYLHSNRGANSDASGDVYIGIEGAHGSNYDDVIFGNDTNNILRGLGGNDLLMGSSSADQLDGGAGVDTVSYSRVQQAVTVRLDLGRGTAGAADGDVYTSIESVTGSEFGDVIYGDSGNNTLTGRGGNDYLVGGDGDDYLIGGILNELRDVTGHNYLIGGDGNDRLIGGGGRDVLIGGAGADYISGNGGINTASYEDSADGVRVDLQLHKGFAGDAAGDTIYGILDLVGSAHADLLNGGTWNETLNGGAGDDRIAGRGGKDRLIGGEGRDVFVYSSSSDSGIGSDNRDTIVDFNRDEGDLVDLATLDANAHVAGDQAFDFLGTAAFTGVAGQLRYIATSLYRVIEMDMNGDGRTDMQIRVDGGGDLLASDFVL